SRVLALAPVQKESFHCPFFAIITKTGATYSYRFIGTGSVLSELEHSRKAIPLAGKEKVHKEILYKEVPQEIAFKEEWLKAVFGLDGVKPDTLQAQFQELFPYKIELKSKDLVATKSDRTEKLFWNAVRALSPNAAPRAE